MLSEGGVEPRLARQQPRRRFRPGRARRHARRARLPRRRPRGTGFELCLPVRGRDKRRRLRRALVRDGVPAARGRLRPSRRGRDVDPSSSALVHLGRRGDLPRELEPDGPRPRGHRRGSGHSLRLASAHAPAGRGIRRRIHSLLAGELRLRRQHRALGPGYGHTPLHGKSAPRTAA